MKNNKYILLSFLFIALFQYEVCAQNVYPLNFEGCNTSQFALESKNETAKIEDKLLTDAITKHLDAKTLKKLRGYLNLQVIVYEDGSCCLLSVENKANQSNNKLDFKQMKNNIDTGLSWKNGTKNVAALIEVKFKKQQIFIKRYGLDANRGWHTLKK